MRFTCLLTSFAISLSSLTAAEFELRLPEKVTRPFVAPEIWTTPMMDWQIANGRLEMIQGGPGHDVQLLSHQLKKGDGAFRMSVRLGELKDHSKEPGPGLVGFKFAVTGAMPDEYRSALFGSQGLMAGITTEGRLFIGNRFADAVIDPARLKDLTLVFEADCKGTDADAVIIAKAGDGAGEEIGKFSAKVSRDPLMGNVGLVCQPQSRAGKGKGKGKAKGKGKGGGGFFRFWFQDWSVRGDKVVEHPKQTFGPILWSQYTVHDDILKLTAHFAPVGPEENQTAKLEVNKGDGWEFIDQARLDPLARTAEFRIEYWDHTRDTPYRITFDWESGEGKKTDTWKGTIRKDPVEKSTISLAALSCMVDYAFPNQYIAENVRDQDPDLVFFAGDQIYEGVAGFGVVRTNTEDDIERATLSYLSKYWLFGWSFREVLKDRPSVIIPDDHDVFHGNIWGKGGYHMPKGGSTSSTGGYNMHPIWVNMVQRTQASSLPDPHDPTPVKNGITVYYTDLNVGGVSFAILEDRKFKSAPGDAIDKPVGGSKRLDHVADPEYDTTKLDKPGLTLLGERQLKFLDEWGRDYEGTRMKAVLSQSPFCSAATTHGGPNGRLAADMDANGWPQTPRNKAHRVIRKAHAIMVHGDQHLATLVHHGVDDWNDSGWSYAAPGIANGYKRLWDPLEPGMNRQPGFPEYTGEFLDGFRNKITVWAAANRVDTIDPEFKLESQSMVDKLNSTGSGYGMIHFDKEQLAITVESWPVYEKWTGDDQFNHEGWPKTLAVEDQYAKEAAAYLPEVDLRRFDHPVVEVTDEKSGEVIYTRRVTGDSFRPKVFDADVTYTVTISDGENERKEEGLASRMRNVIMGNVAKALLPVFFWIGLQKGRTVFRIWIAARATAQAGVPVLLALSAQAQLPSEPLTIERGVPQFVFDSHMVDNRWAIKYKRQSVRKVHHSPAKHPENPFEIFAEDNPSYVWVIKEGDLFRMYYQANFKVRDDSEAGRKYHTEVAYAESKDGIHWTKPDLDLFPEKTWAGAVNNVVIGFPDRPNLEACSPVVLEGLPEADQRGYKFIVLYRSKGKGGGDVSGIRLIGTKDGIHFDFENDTRIAHLHSDHHNSISYDPAAKDYVMFCRAKQMYRAFGEEMIDTGASRRIAIMRSPELWGDWLEHDQPRTLLIPDSKDDETNRHFFYGMPTVHRHGVFWGFLEPFRMNDFIHTELATSRDGETWQRLPERPRLIEYGEEGSWDDTMIFGSPGWVEVGDEWYFYYTGWDGPHGTTERSGSVGLATCKRERLISLRGPTGGGVVATRTLIWPGGDLWVNATAVAGREEKSEITVRISDPKRKVLEGFDHSESELRGDDDTRRAVHWSGGKSARSFEGQTIRIEIFLKDADLFSFGATPE